MPGLGPPWELPGSCLVEVLGTDKGANLAAKHDNAISLAPKRGKLVSLIQASEFRRLGLPGGAAWAY